MREEKVIMDFPDIADKLIEKNMEGNRWQKRHFFNNFLIALKAQGPEPSLCTENEKV